LTEIAQAPYDLVSVTSGTTVIVLDANFATSGMVETAQEVGGSHALTLTGDFDAADAFLIAYDDGTNTYLARVRNAIAGSTLDDGDTLDVGSLVVESLITFTGLSDAGTLTAANLGGAFI